MLNFNPNEAKQADHISSAISETGKYKGILTRAEKLHSKKGTQGLGLSFKSDDGATSDYLDLYTINAKGETLPSMKVVQAIMGCMGIRQAEEGDIQCEKYDRETRQREKIMVTGYPGLMGKRIGLLLQKELSTNNETGKDVERMIIAGVFQADTELTISEILDRKTAPERLGQMVAALKPVRDSRKGAGAPKQASGHNGGDDAFADMIDDIPFRNCLRGNRLYVI